MRVKQIEARYVGRDPFLVWSAHAALSPSDGDQEPNKPLQPTASRARSLLFGCEPVQRARGG